MVRSIFIILFYSAPSPRHQLMMKALKSAGYQVHVLAWNRSGDIKNTSNYSGLFDTWQFIDVASPTGSYGVLFSLVPYYCKLITRLRLADSNQMLWVGHLMLLPVALLYRKRVVYDACEMFAIDGGNYFPVMKIFSRNVLFWLEGMMAHHLAGVTCVDSKGGWLVKFYRKWNPNVQVIWNVTSKEDEPEHTAFTNTKTVYSGSPVIAYAGGIMKAKGLRVALEAACLVKEKHPDCLFLFIGPFHDNVLEIKAFVKEKGLIQNICIKKSVSYQSLLSLLRHADIGLALHQRNIKDSFDHVSAGNGRKFFTYMQAGLPIVGPSFGEVGKIVSLADCGILVDTESPQAVANAIFWMMEHPENRRQMGHNGRKAFQEKYNWEIEKKKFIDFLDSITANAFSTHFIV